MDVILRKLVRLNNESYGSVGGRRQELSGHKIQQHSRLGFLIRALEPVGTVSYRHYRLHLSQRWPRFGETRLLSTLHASSRPSLFPCRPLGPANSEFPSLLPSYRDRFRGRVPNWARDTRVADHVPKCAKT